MATETSRSALTQSLTLSARSAEAAFQRDRLSRIEYLVQAGRAAEAIFLANFTDWRGALSRANFNPAEPRDDRGWWTNGNSNAGSLYEQIQYRGYFHDFVVQDLINGLNAHGGKAIANVKVFGINGVLAIPDGASLPKGWIIPYFIEVKTGIDPPFSENQQKVYPLICLGGHAVSLDPRIKQLGLTPGEVLPPMDIMVVHTAGPGRALTFYNYCEKIGLRGSK